MPVTYLGARDVARAGITITHLCRFTGLLSSPAVVGDTLLTLGASPIVVPSDLVNGDPITILDGIQSEVLYAKGSVDPNVYTVACTALQNSHAAGAEYTLDGATGSLGALLLRAGAQLENYTRQSLLQQSYSDMQRLHLSARALRRDGGLVLLPTWYPVRAINALSLQYDGMWCDPLVLDPAQVAIDTVRERCFVPYRQLLSSAFLYADDEYTAQGMLSSGVRMMTSTLSYQAGYPYGALPADLASASLLYVRSEMAMLDNPTGAQSVKMGQRQVTYRAGSATGVSTFEQEAQDILRNSYVKSGHRRS